jgi:hypothetical protein
MKTALALIAISAASFAVAACGSDSPDDSASRTSAAPTVTAEATPAKDAEAASTEGTPITITAGDTKITATLNDSDVAEDFAEMLPVDLTWFRNAGIEYITELDAPLTETGPLLHRRPGGLHRLLQPARQHHDHLRADPLGSDHNEDGRGHVRPERLRRAPGQHGDADRTWVEPKPTLPDTR